MDNKRFKALLTLLLVLVLVVSISACGMGENAPGPLEGDADSSLGELTANNETDGVVEFPNNDESVTNGTEKADKDNASKEPTNTSSSNKNNSINNNTSNDNKTNGDSSGKKPSTNNSGASSNQSSSGNNTGSSNNSSSGNNSSTDEDKPKEEPAEKTVTVKKAIYDEYTSYWILCPDKTIAGTYRSYQDMQPNLKKFTKEHNHTHNWASEDKCDFLRYDLVGVMTVSEYKNSKYYNNPDYLVVYN